MPVRLRATSVVSSSTEGKAAKSSGLIMYAATLVIIGATAALRVKRCLASRRHGQYSGYNGYYKRRCSAGAVVAGYLPDGNTEGTLSCLPVAAGRRVWWALWPSWVAM